jgi:uncharacterized membrane protein YccC
MDRTRQRARGLLIAGIVLIVIGAGLMDQAGRSHEDLWWNISGAFAFAGFLLSVVSLFMAEGSALLPHRLRSARSGAIGKHSE